MGHGPVSLRAFGSTNTPHVLLQHYRAGAWEPARVLASGPLQLAPLTHALHYGASIFEGFKAHRQPDGSLALFRARDHLRRLNRSAERMCLPQVDAERLCQDVLRLLRADADQAPAPPDALYVRPLLFADEALLGYATPASATLLVALVPVKPLFQGRAGVRLRTELEYVRAAPGGTGAAKCAGNYAGALRAQQRARAEGFDEVLWLDALERRWLEEAGGMNLMLVRGGALSTPPLSDTILAGITRDSLLTLARDAGLAVEERAISTDPREWQDVSEAFTSGTAAGTAHIREIRHGEHTLFARAEPGPLTRRLGEALEALKFGRAPDAHGWRLPVG